MIRANAPLQPRLRIANAPPVRGERKALCVTDEASVSRMVSPQGYAGLVERFQRAPAGSGSFESKFELIFSSHSPVSLSLYPGSYAFHAVRALSLAFGNSILPGTFVNPHELRLSLESGCVHSAMYSRFVPDESGVVERRKKSARRFYSEQDFARRLDLLKGYDLSENRRTASLRTEVERIAAAGISVPHPEANYHVNCGKVVFFEICELDLKKAHDAAINQSHNPGLPMGLLSAIYAITVRACAKRTISLDISSGHAFAASTERFNPLLGLSLGRVVAVLDTLLRRCKSYPEAFLASVYAEPAKLLCWAESEMPVGAHLPFRLAHPII